MRYEQKKFITNFLFDYVDYVTGSTLDVILLKKSSNKEIFINVSDPTLQPL